MTALLSRFRRGPGAAALLCAGLAVAGPSPAAEDDPVLATVNGHPVRRSDVYRQVEALPLGEQIPIRQQMDRFAESVVREEILFQYLLSSGFDAEPGLRDEVKAMAVERLIGQQVKERIRVTDEQVNAFYRENASVIRGEEVRASHILLAARPQCEALAPSLASDDDFRAAARARSLDRDSAARDGDIGLFMNHGGPYGFETSLFTMQEGEMRVFDSPAGCHLVRITARNTPPLPPIAQVEGRIRELLRARQERALLGALLERARQSVEVRRPAAAP